MWVHEVQAYIGLHQTSVMEFFAKTFSEKMAQTSKC